MVAHSQSYLIGFLGIAGKEITDNLKPASLCKETVELIKWKFLTIISLQQEDACLKIKTMKEKNVCFGLKKLLLKGKGYLRV
jgi:hypothetical protein